MTAISRLLVGFLVSLTLLATSRSQEAKTASTPASEITVPPGFKVELLRSATPREGSWVSMAIDDKGRLYISPQAKAPDGDIMRVTLTADGQVGQVDWLKVNVGAAMGMLWAFDSLYVSGQGPDGQAIYRLRDTNADDELDEVKLFKKVPGGAGEHGAHALVVGPDKQLYIVHGNSTPLVEGIAENSPYRHWQEDTLLPRVMDPVATFFDKLKIPYGHVYRTDPEGKRWELFAGGMRNAYDIDFNQDGELFTYDSDMEWDIGLPWYRPTRILHVTAGAEFGFREGNSKWPDYYPDSLPGVVDVGLGSPTGVKFGTRSNYPDRYKKAFFAMDWTYGRILAVHLQPKGASYTASNPLPSRYNLAKPSSSSDVEVFLSGKGMPVTDLEFGKDGAMYFTVGGRGTQAALYRVSWGPSEEQRRELRKENETAAATTPVNDRQGTFARETRREIEWLAAGAPGPLQGVADSDREALRATRKALESEDRFLSFAARQVVEQMKPEAIGELLADEQEPRRALHLTLALARVGTKDDREAILKALAKWPLDSLDEEGKLNKLRVIQVCFARHGKPSEELVKLAIDKLSRQYPAKTFPLNRELSQLLVYLEAPDVVVKTLDLLASSQEPAEQIWYACVLREAKSWSPQQRETYFAWFNKARAYRGGNSFAKFILRIREQAVAKLTESERIALATLLAVPVDPPKPVTSTGPARPFIKAWTVAELEPDLSKVASGRNFARGKELFSSLQCLTCHRFGNEGGSIGPDITAAANRFNHRDLLETIIEPSKVISDQYATLIVTSKNGETFMGPVAEDNNMSLVLVTDAVSGDKTSIGKNQIKSREVSKMSLMPPGLVNSLTKDEILDLLAYIESGGNSAAKQFSGSN